MPRTALLNTDTEDLKELLSNGKGYSVPAYQRDYSWKQEHWEDLWDDLKNAEANRDDHYMGTIVLESGERKQFRIIDGQQRLATLSILILACVDYLYDLAHQQIHAANNTERAELLESSYLGAKDPSSLRITPKLKLNANDDDFFQLNLAQRKAPLGGVRGLRDSEKLLWGCFQFFKRNIQSKFAKFEKQLSGVDVSDEAMDATVEHILPENPADSGWEHFTSEAFERCYDRIGNYSLLERNLNSRQACNASFSEKQLIYARSKYRTSEQLTRYSEWTEQTINSRQAPMAQAAKSI